MRDRLIFIRKVEHEVNHLEVAIVSRGPGAGTSRIRLHVEPGEMLEPPHRPARFVEPCIECAIRPTARSEVEVHGLNHPNIWNGTPSQAVTESVVVTPIVSLLVARAALRAIHVIGNPCLVCTRRGEITERQIAAL